MSYDRYGTLTGLWRWPFERSCTMHGRERERFARHADGRVETWPAHRQS